MSTWSLTYQQSVFKQYHSYKHLSEFYPQDGAENQLATERNYVIVTLCITHLKSLASSAPMMAWAPNYRNGSRDPDHTQLGDS